MITMAWGKAPVRDDACDDNNKEIVPSYVNLIRRNDPFITSITVFRDNNNNNNNNNNNSVSSLNVMKRRQCELLSEALRGNAYVEEFYASGHEINEDVIDILGEALKKSESLKSICIGCEKLGTNEKEFDRLIDSYLSEMGNLRVLDLENKGLRSTSVISLAKAFENEEKFKQLEELILNKNFNNNNNNNNSSDGDDDESIIIAVDEAFERLFKSGALRNRLRTIQFSEMCLAEKSLIALANELKDEERCSLEVFKFTHGKFDCGVLLEQNDVEEKIKDHEDKDDDDNELLKKEIKEKRDKAMTEMMNVLGEGIANNKSLKTITLDGTKVGAYELLKGISRAKKIDNNEEERRSKMIEISLANCALDDNNSRTNATVGFFLSDFAEPIEIVNLSGNSLGDWKVAQLAGAIRGGFCQNITDLDVSANDLSDSNILKRFLFGTKIKKLSLFENVNMLKSKENVLKIFADFNDDAGNDVNDETKLKVSAHISACEYLDVGACGMEVEELILFAQSVRKHKSAFKCLKTLVVGGNPGCSALDDSFELELKLLKEAFGNALDVGWKASDSGEIDKLSY